MEKDNKLKQLSAQLKKSEKVLHPPRFAPKILFDPPTQLFNILLLFLGYPEAGEGSKQAQDQTVGQGSLPAQGRPETLLLLLQRAA